MIDVIKFSMKIISVGYQSMHIMQDRLDIGIDISGDVFCKCSSQI